MRVAQVVVLSIALAAGGVAAFLAYTPPGPSAPPPPLPLAPLETDEILVAAKDISIGQVMSAQDMEWHVWPKASTSPQDVLRRVQPDAQKSYEGNLARVPIQRGWPIWASNLIDAKLKVSSAGYMAAKLPVGKRAIAVEIAADNSAGGSILPNDHVDVIHTHKDRAREKITNVETFVSDTLLTNIPVRAVDQTFEEKGGIQTHVGRTATLEVTPEEAEDIASARLDGRLSLSLRSVSENESSPDFVARRRAKDAPPVDKVVNICRPLVCEPYRLRPEDVEAAARNALN
jgi:pilus assembly protein CpaB